MGLLDLLLRFGEITLRHKLEVKECGLLGGGLFALGCGGVGRPGGGCCVVGGERSTAAVVASGENSIAKPLDQILLQAPPYHPRT